MKPMDKTVQVSVIMTAYNAQTYLAEAIDSVLNQSFTNFEFLIHDDGSTDGTLGILESYAAQDARIIVTTASNQGVFAARNFLQNKAQGEFLAVMDADDICLPDRLEKQMAYMATEAHCAAVGGANVLIDVSGRPILLNAMPTGHEAIDGQNIRGVVSIHHPTVLMRKDAVVKAGGYDPSFKASGDLDLWLRMAEMAQLANLPDLVLKYRIHDNSISGSKRDLQRQMCRQACEAAWLRRGLTDVSFDYSEWRMTDTPESRQEFNLRYGWQAWSNGYRDTWRHYALQSVKQAPFSLDAWKLLIFGGLRRPARHTSHQDG